ncbi:MAG: zinc ribbon domain-containing protein [Thermoplasmata archaeon]
MHVRAILTLVNFVVVAIALAIFFLDPSIASIAVYAVLIWMFASLVIFYLPGASRQFHPSGPPVAPGVGPVGSGGPAGAPPLPTSGIGFCIYCGTNLTAGAATCPACGRTVRFA